MFLARKSFAAKSGRKENVMNNLNFATIAGRLVADPDVRTTPNGTNRSTFTVAVNRGRDKTDFIPVQMYGGSETLMSQLVKGASVLVTGRFENTAYQKDGVQRMFASLNADTVRISAGSINNIVVDGNLTADPEVRTTPNGTSVTTLRLACNRSYKDKATGEWKDAPASFLTVTAWERTAEFVARYFKKGDGIIVAGRLSSRSYETKAGDKRTAYDIIANEVSFGGKPKPKDAAPAAPAAPAQPAANVVSNDDFMVIDDDGMDDLPF